MIFHISFIIFFVVIIDYYFLSISQFHLSSILRFPRDRKLHSISISYFFITIAIEFLSNRCLLGITLSVITPITTFKTNIRYYVTLFNDYSLTSLFRRN